MRSQKLRNWIRQYFSSEEIVESLEDMPAAQSNELLDEACEDNELKLQYFELCNDPQTEGNAEAITLREYCKRPQIFNGIRVSQIGWQDGEEPRAVIKGLSELFLENEISEDVKRKVHCNKVIFSQTKIAIKFTGEELDKFDRDVYFSLLSLACDWMDCEGCISTSTFLEKMGLNFSSRNAERLKRSLIRLSRSLVHVVVGQRENQIPLLSDFSWNQGSFFTYEMEIRGRSLFENKYLVELEL